MKKLLLLSLFCASPLFAGSQKMDFHLLIQALDNEDPSAIGPVNQMFLKMGPSAVPALAQALSDDNFVIRQNVMALLGLFGPAATEAVPAIIDHLSDTNYEVQKVAVETFIALGPETLPVIDRTLAHSIPGVRRQVIELMPRFGAPALPMLMSLLKKDDTWYVRVAAIQALAEIHIASAEVVASLQSVLKEPDDRIRLAAISGLDKLGPDAAPAVEQLLAMANTDKDNLIREKSLQAARDIR
jgi:HEAT repeat protein